MASRELKLRRADACVECGSALDAGVRAWWDADSKTVTCLECRAGAAEPDVVTESASGTSSGELVRGEAGASIQREYEKRRANHERRTREKHRLTGGLRLRIQDEPQHLKAFRTGAAGEREVARSLARWVPADRAEFLFNRQMPGGRGDIDNLAVSAQGVWVIDSKNLNGKKRIERVRKGDDVLWVNGRRRTKLLDGLDRQVAAVREVLSGYPDVEVFGVLCVTDGNLPAFGSRKVRGHSLLHHYGLARALRSNGELDAARRAEIARVLAEAFPVA